MISIAQIVDYWTVAGASVAIILGIVELWRLLTKNPKIRLEPDWKTYEHQGEIVFKLHLIIGNWGTKGTTIKKVQLFGYEDLENGKPPIASFVKPITINLPPNAAEIVEVENSMLKRVGEKIKEWKVMVSYGENNKIIHILKELPIDTEIM